MAGEMTLADLGAEAVEETRHAAKEVPLSRALTALRFRRYRGRVLWSLPVRLHISSDQTPLAG